MRKLKPREVKPPARSYPDGVQTQAAHGHGLCSSPQNSSDELLYTFVKNRAHPWVLIQGRAEGTHQTLSSLHHIQKSQRDLEGALREREHQSESVLSPC